MINEARHQLLSDFPVLAVLESGAHERDGVVFSMTGIYNMLIITDDMRWTVLVSCHELNSQCKRQRQLQMIRLHYSLLVTKFLRPDTVTAGINY